MDAHLAATGPDTTPTLRSLTCGTTATTWTCPVRLRTLHAYMAIFTAPSILFFALTGALQLFDLHEPHPGYKPPVLIEKLGRLHKDQVFARDDRRPDAGTAVPAGAASGTAAAAPPAAAADSDDPVSARVLKWFFLLVTLVLAATTGFGLWLGLRRNPRKPLGWFLLASGLALPAVMVML